MDTRLFWRAAAVQGALVGVLFVLLLLALPDDFFDDWGLLVGPLAWVACALVAGRILALPLGYALLCAAAGGVAGTLVGLVFPHPVGGIVAVAVFAACAAGYEQGEPADSAGQTSTP